MLPQVHSWGVMKWISWKFQKTIVHGSPIFSRGPLSFYINLCNPGECRKMRPVKNTSEWSMIASDDDIRVLFFHVVLSTVSTVPFLWIPWETDFWAWDSWWGGWEEEGIPPLWKGCWCLRSPAAEAYPLGAGSNCLAPRQGQCWFFPLSAMWYLSCN